MFVKFKSSVMGLIAGATLALGATTASLAADAQDSAKSVPLVLTVNNIQPNDAPLYISVQTKADYRSMKGSGTIIKAPNASTLTQTINVPTPGRYAVSLWHDLDGDGRFSMNERYEILDGWGSSGSVPAGVAPTFEDAAIDIPAIGANAAADMIYPKG